MVEPDGASGRFWIDVRYRADADRRAGDVYRARQSIESFKTDLEFSQSDRAVS